MKNALELWVIYDHPSDFPDCFVARKWLNNTPTATFITGNSLEELRVAIPQGLVCLPRDKHDDVKIVETWI